MHIYHGHSKAANTVIVPMLNITKFSTFVLQSAAARGDDDSESQRTELMQEAAFAHKGMPLKHPLGHLKDAQTSPAV